MNRTLIGLFVVAIILSLTPVTNAGANASGQGGTYTVQPGDNLFRISLRFGITVRALQQANGLTSNLIYVGQVLTIPGVAGAPSSAPATSVPAPVSGGTYTVKGGDTLWRIAINNGTSVAAIQQANGLSSSLIFVGQVLALPGNSSAPAATATPPPASGTAAPAPTATPTPATSGGGTYTVKPGDTLWRIALDNGTTVAAIQQANGLTSSIIFVGQVLTIPGSGGSGGTVPTTAAPTATTPPPSTSTGFALGGQVAGFGSNAVTAMQSAGMTWAKRQITWAPGASAASQTGHITDAHTKGFKILLSVVGGPTNSGSGNFTEYATYVAALAGAGADAIEVWNEPNIDREWAAGQISPANYTSLLSQAYTAIKAANANTMVITGAPAPTGFYGGCTTNGCDDALFISGMVSAGALNYADCIGIHYNEGLLPPSSTSGDPRGNSSHYTRYYTSMVNTYWAAVGGAKQLCFTEIGYLSGEEWGTLPAGFLWLPPYNLTVQQHADYLGQAAALAKSQGRVKLFVVFNVDFTVFTTDPQAGYAIIRPDGSCPACSKLAAAVGS